MGRGGQVGGQRGQQLKVRLQSRHSLHHCGVVATPSDLEVLPGSAIAVRDPIEGRRQSLAGQTFDLSHQCVVCQSIVSEVGGIGDRGIRGVLL